MRYFTELHEAVPEILRDLYKAPVYRSERVQHRTDSGRKMHEAQGYSYTIGPYGVPNEPREIIQIAADYLGDNSIWQDDDFRERVHNWMSTEVMNRLEPWPPMGDDSWHPVLRDMREGNEFSYAYRERMIGAVEQLTHTLLQEPTTRRAYWPIFEQHDARRSHLFTRIPCSLGYYAALREVDGYDEPSLHLTYIQRSCDADIFWLTDLWFADQLKSQLISNLIQNGLPAGEGSTTHIILSFHKFVDPDAEVY